MIDNSIGESYNSVPYHGHAFAHTDINHLSALGALFSLSPKLPSQANVLEVGCAEGRNLFPLAVRYPKAKFLGIDLSSKQIAVAEDRRKKLDLDNISFLVQDVLSMESKDAFDFIIIHGLYSWVPEDARIPLLARAQSLLAPNGLIYVSYNTLPGWHFRNILRDFLLYATRNCISTDDRLRAARESLAIWSKAHSNPLTAGHQMIGTMLNSLNHLPDWYIFHELLENHNNPLYFSRFVEEASAANLQYVCDAELATVSDYDLPEAAQSAVRTLADDMLSHEQFNDFIRQRMFRRSLLTQKNLSIPRSNFAAEVEKLFFSSPLIPTSRSTTGTTFEDPHGVEVVVEDKPLASALTALSSTWPGSLAFNDIHAATSTAGGISRAELGQNLFHCLMQGTVFPHREAVALPSKVEDFPQLSPLTCLEATWDNHVTSFKHEDIVLSKEERFLATLLDGKHSKAALAKLMQEKFAIGEEDVTRILDKMREHALL
ncbi:MAG: class I SAM-dependent methyltransferase [bacterium]|nr:class I SAM-dependent methyltransferase [bacterium]